MKEKKPIITQDAPSAIGAYSQGMCVGDFVFTSGQIPIDPKTYQIPKKIKEQAEVALKNVSAVLEAGGSSLDDAVKVTIFMKKIKHFEAVNEVYKKFFKNDFPARSAVGVKKLPKKVLIEIEAIGIKK